MSAPEVVWCLLWLFSMGFTAGWFFERERMGRR